MCNRKPTLHLMVGLPGSGKTTWAKQLEREHSALRLTPDEWHIALFGEDMGHPEHDERHDRVERVMWAVAERALALGMDVILDFGFWSRRERDQMRESARKLGADCWMHYMDVPLDEIWRRLSLRNAQTEQNHVFFVSRANLDEWAGMFEAPEADERMEAGRQMG